VAIVSKESHDKEQTKEAEEAEVTEEVKKIIKNRGIKEEDFDNLLSATMNSIPGLDEETKKDYHE
jgi:hypothetical protein